MFMYKYAKPGIHFDEDKEVNKGIKMSDILEKIAENKQKLE